MNAPELFYEDYWAALRDDVQALGGAKVMGPLLFPEKSVEAARNKLNDMLNAERRERLSHEQEQLIKRRAREVRGFSAALYCDCDETGFKRPEPRDPLDEQAQLQKDFIQATKTIDRIAQRMEQNGWPGWVRAVK